MSVWEYKVVPAPSKGIKGRGIKGPEGRFANALERLMNDMGANGWEYHRAEILPSVERSGLTGSTTDWRNMLVFRRSATQPMDDFEPELLPPPALETPAPKDIPARENGDARSDAAQPPAEKQGAHAEKPAVAPSESDAGQTKGILEVTETLKGLSGQSGEAKSNG